MDKIKKEHILAAIKEIEANPRLRKGRASSTYDLIYNDIAYPPKLVISLANRHATGKELDSNEFYGGPNKPAFDLLIKEGFTIVEKNTTNNYNIINEYISKLKSGEISAAQSIKTLIETKNFENNLKVLDQIFFDNKLKEINSHNYENTITYIKDVHKINSKVYNEFNIWSASKNLLRNINSELIKQHDELNLKVGFPDNGNGLYKSFLGEKNFIAYLLDKFEQTHSKIPNKNDNNIGSTRNNFIIESFHEKTKEAGLNFSAQLIQRFVASLCTKPFVICSGLSGSGKTKLAQAFVQWISESDKQYKIIPVGADWTNREPLLGYPNGLDPITYVTPDSGALQLILEASKEDNKNRPYFMILDEMNLSHVERYFADFLSIMESEDKIKLYSGEKRYSKYVKEVGFEEMYFIPNEIDWPKNLFIIGTVNIDETTYMFSPKVLDRANVIEFRISENDMGIYLEKPGKVEMKKLFIDEDKDKAGIGASCGIDFMNIYRTKHNTNTNRVILKEFFKELQKAGAEFGYRSASEINELIGVLEFINKENTKWNFIDINKPNDLIDIAIMQKLLPKLHGSRNKLTPVLTALGKLCVEGATVNFINKDKEFRQNYFETENDLDIKFKISFEKIKRMYHNANANGFSSYAEA